MAKKVPKIKFSKIDHGCGASMEFDPGPDLADGFNEKKREAQPIYDMEFLRYCEPYVPHATGNFQQRTITYNIPLVGTGYVAWPGPFAHYLHEGILYVDPITGKGAFYSEDYGFWSRPGVDKVPSDRLLEYGGDDKRGSHWDDRMWLDHKKDLENTVAEVYNKGGK